MDVFNNIDAWKAQRRTFIGSLGLIPTMGFLHEGHLSLVRRAKEENDAVVVWIFVNPSQFAPSEDFSTYPRDMDNDLRLLEELDTDFVLAPSLEDVYPSGFQTHVQVEEVSKPLEGHSRPEHFQGVATVVAKMIGITQSHRTYFGQKDGQQCAVVKTMVRDLSIPTEIVVCPTVREPDGLAMSSRNARLKPEHRSAAPVVYRALLAGREALLAPEGDAEAARHRMREVLDEESLARIDYVSAAYAETLLEIESRPDGEETVSPFQGTAMLSMAVNFGSVRLIDNLLVEVSEAISKERSSQEQDTGNTG